MQSVYKLPKPHFNKGTIGLPKPVKYDRKKVLKEMGKLIDEDNSETHHI